MLVTTQPTRGPWQLSDKSPFLVIGFEPRLYPDQERCTIAHVDPNGDRIPTEISEANARLIAAAPELVEALKAAMSLCSAVGGFEGNEFYRMQSPHSWDTLLKLVQDLLSKCGS